MSNQQSNLKKFATTTGHDLGESEWLDRHFVASQPEYEMILRSVGIEKGWRILDAGCGGGIFIPLMSELVGEGGHISALDMAQENIERVKARIKRERFSCPVEPKVGSVTVLPYDNDQFDAVWCANVTQYLTNEELAVVLSEFLRVTRSGGLVAIKEFDATLHQFYPPDPTFLLRMYDTVRNHNQTIHGVLRAISLQNWFKKAGFVDVQRETIIMERFAPLRPVEQQFISEAMQFISGLGLKYGVQDPNLIDICHLLTDPEKVNVLIGQPDYHYREGHALIVGRVSK
jgi:arsenite methyltransferase